MTGRVVHWFVMDRLQSLPERATMAHLNACRLDATPSSTILAFVTCPRCRILGGLGALPPDEAQSAEAPGNDDAELPAVKRPSAEEKIDALPLHPKPLGDDEHG